MDETVLAKLSEIGASPRSRASRSQEAAELIRQATGARWIGIYSVAADVASNEAWSGPAAPAYPSFPVTQGLTSHAVRSGSIAVSNDVANDPRYLTNQDDSGSELIVPILDEESAVIGTLDVESADVGAFDGPGIAGYELLALTLRLLWTGRPIRD